jgi:hypothetical protein
VLIQIWGMGYCLVLAYTETASEVPGGTLMHRYFRLTVTDDRAFLGGGMHEEEPFSI